MAVPTPFFRQDSHSLVILWGLDPTYSMEDMATGIGKAYKYSWCDGLREPKNLRDPATYIVVVYE